MVTNANELMTRSTDSTMNQNMLENLRRQYCEAQYSVEENGIQDEIYLTGRERFNCVIAFFE